LRKRRNYQRTTTPYYSRNNIRHTRKKKNPFSAVAYSVGHCSYRRRVQTNGVLPCSRYRTIRKRNPPPLRGPHPSTGYVIFINRRRCLRNPRRRTTENRAIDGRNLEKNSRTALVLTVRRSYPPSSVRSRQVKNNKIFRVISAARDVASFDRTPAGRAASRNFPFNKRARPRRLSFGPARASARVSNTKAQRSSIQNPWMVTTTNARYCVRRCTAHTTAAKQKRALLLYSPGSYGKRENERARLSNAYDALCGPTPSYEGRCKKNTKVAAKNVPAEINARQHNAGT